MKTNGLGWGAVDELDAVGQARERVAMGLRVVEGFAVSDIEALRLQLNAENVGHLAALGFLVVRDGRVVLTPEGAAARGPDRCGNCALGRGRGARASPFDRLRVRRSRTGGSQASC